MLALGASVVTWVVAQTVLGSLARYGEKLEAVVSLVAIGVLLLILNWFYHRVYWQENLQDLHRRKKSILAGAGLSLAAAQVVGLVALGFTSVYREGFETTLFLQALTLEAGAWTVLQGVMIGFAAVVAVFFLVVSLERRLPHKKMLIVTGVMITWVLVVLVGQTVQVMQKVGWIPVTPIEGLGFRTGAACGSGSIPPGRVSSPSSPLRPSSSAATSVPSTCVAQVTSAHLRRGDPLTARGGNAADPYGSIIFAIYQWADVPPRADRRRGSRSRFPAAAAAADLTAVPREFSPDESGGAPTRSSPRRERAGVQLATNRRGTVGWVVEPQRRRFLTPRWDGRLGRCEGAGTAATCPSRRRRGVLA